MNDNSAGQAPADSVHPADGESGQARAERDRLDRLARGWDEAADGYDAYFVPRFAPWLHTAVEAFTATALPGGPILVPCCGTFPELEPLLAHLPDREIVGIDLSAGMVDRARRRVAALSSSAPHVNVLQGDAAALAPHWSGRCAGVVSAFGLQQLPDPASALRSWTAALRPGGRLSVLYWPDVTESDGPFELMRRLVRGDAAADGDGGEPDLVTVLSQHAVIERDEHVSHPVSHPDAATFCDAYTRSGPLRAMALARGEAFIDRLRDQFLGRAPAGPWRHHPRARLIVARRG